MSATNPPAGAAKPDGAAIEARWEGREGWGMASSALCRVVRPRSADDVLAAYALARAEGKKVAFWGNGRSYGDAALNEGNLLLDFSGMNRILSLDKATGIIVCEPGVTLRQLWQDVLPQGFWPPVVTGTMFTTLGGMLSANAHGKNNFKHGPIGDHLLAFTLVTPDGAVREVTRESEPALFHATIGGMGWLGAVTRITLKLKRVHSGRLSVAPVPAEDLSEMFRLFERYNREDQDYVVGWIDAYARGASLGRGQIHFARYVAENEDPAGKMLVRPEDQELPPRMFGILPFAWLHWFARPFANRLGMRLINFGRYWFMKVREGEVHPHLQEHARFNFLLDFVPNWKWFTKPGGLIQFQLFLPKETAEATTRRVFELAQEARLEPYLVVMKRHRKDAYWLSHAVDGYSFAMDFFVKDDSRADLWRLCQVFSERVVAAGGKFYLAKDSTLTGSAFRAAFGDGLLGRFFALKRRVDPDGLLQGNQFRRLFAELDTAALAKDGEAGLIAWEAEQRAAAQKAAEEAANAERAARDAAEAASRAAERATAAATQKASEAAAIPAPAAVSAEAASPGVEVERRQADQSSSGDASKTEAAAPHVTTDLPAAGESAPAAPPSSAEAGALAGDAADPARS